MKKEENFEKIAFVQRENFVSMLKHDIKIPIIAQIRALELLEDEKLGQLNREQKEVVSLTLNSCRTIYEMLSEMLSVFKNEKTVFDYENVNILKIIENYFSNVKNIAEDKKINIFVQNDSYYPIIRADKFQIQKSFEYIANYCISCAAENTKFYCRVSDLENFINIELVFENPYFTEEKLDDILNRQNQMHKIGTQLEICLAKQIILSHNGTINVKKDGVSNIYSINLPLIHVNNVT